MKGLNLGPISEEGMEFFCWDYWWWLMKRADNSPKKFIILITFVLLLVSGSSVYAQWALVPPPYVSSYWWLSGVHFTSPNEGWAVGVDWENERQGVLLYYLNGSWTTVTPPYVSSEWELRSVHFTSSNEGWAVGLDREKGRGALLHYLNGSWTGIIPPYVSSDWELFGVHFTSPNEGWAVGSDWKNERSVLLHYLNTSWIAVDTLNVSSVGSLFGVHFTSSNEGWAVGFDWEQGRGALLHYLNGSWTGIIPPYISSDWGLGSVHFTSSNEGWAVGSDYENGNGVLLHYLNGSWTVIDPPYISSDWGLLEHDEYDIVGGVYFTSPNVGWAVGWRKIDSANYPGVLLRFYISPITLQSPSNDAHFTACSLNSSPPTFSWIIAETFKSYEIQFSLDNNFSSPIKVKVSGIQAILTSATWKKVLLISGGAGGTVYWRVVGTRAKKTTFTSEVRSIILEPSEPVGTPTVSPTSKTSLPELSWQNNCNTKFKVWFGNDESFNKKNGYSFNIRNPNDNGGIFTKMLTSGQWKAIRKLVGDVSGPTIYWYVESWDGLNRYSKTEVMDFTLSE